MKPFKQTLIWLILLAWVHSMVTPAISDDKEEKWRKDLEKDYQSVLKSKSKEVERHRGLVGKWQEKGHLAELILLYEADAPTEAADAGVPTRGTPYLHYGLGYAYAIQGGEGALEKAAAQFEKAISIEPNLLLAHFSLGGVYQQQEKYAPASQEMETCLRLEPKYYPAHYKRGEIYLIQKNLDGALKSFQAALELNKKWEYPHYGIGLVYFEQGNDNAAREAFEQTIDLNKKFAPAHFKLGQVLAKERFFDDALQEYQEGAKYQPYTAEVLYELGAIFAQEGNRSGAVNLYQSALKINPRYAPAHLQLGEIYYAMGEGDSAAGRVRLPPNLPSPAEPREGEAPAEAQESEAPAEPRTLAIEHYKQAFQADPNLKDYFINQLGPYHAGLMGVEQAKSLLDRALTVNPDDPRAYFYYAQIETDAGNITAAIQYYEKTIALIETPTSPPTPPLLGGVGVGGKGAGGLGGERGVPPLPLGSFLDAYLALGNLYYQQGDNEKAAATYRRAIELDPKLERHFFDQGKTAFDAEQYDRAIEPFNKFLLLYPEAIDATYLLGRSYEASEDVKNALRLYARTIELDANRKDALMRSAQLYRSQNDPQNALTMLTQLIAIAPSNVEAHYLSGLSYLELNRPDDALAAFLETTHLEPNHVDAHYHLASLYEQKGNTDNVVEQYETIIRLDPSKAEPFLRVGAIYQKQGDKDNLIRVYEQGLAIEPNHPQMQYDLAALFEERGENEKAILHFGHANQYDEAHYDWHFRYARLLDRDAAGRQDYNQHAAMAVEEYSKTIALKPDYAPAYFQRALITRRYKQIGGVLYRYSQIAEDFKQVVALESKNADAHYYLGMTYLDLDQRREAKEFFLKTLRLNRKYKGANLQLGLIAEWEQNSKEAIPYFEAEVAIAPKSAQAYQRLGNLYGSYVTDLGRAKETLQKALKLEPNHVPTLLNYGNTLFNLDQLGAAIEQFERAIQLEPTDFTANYNLALMYEYTGKKQQAIERWKIFLKLNPPAEWKSDAERHLQQLQP